MADQHPLITRRRIIVLGDGAADPDPVGSQMRVGTDGSSYGYSATLTGSQFGDTGTVANQTIDALYVSNGNQLIADFSGVFIGDTIKVSIEGAANNPYTLTWTQFTTDYRLNSQATLLAYLTAQNGNVLDITYNTPVEYLRATINVGTNGTSYGYGTYGGTITNDTCTDSTVITGCSGVNNGNIVIFTSGNVQINSETTLYVHWIGLGRQLLTWNGTRYIDVNSTLANAIIAELGNNVEVVILDTDPV